MGGQPGQKNQTREGPEGSPGRSGRHRGCAQSPEGTHQGGGNGLKLAQLVACRLPVSTRGQARGRGPSPRFWVERAQIRAAFKAGGR